MPSERRRIEWRSVPPAGVPPVTDVPLARGDVVAVPSALARAIQTAGVPSVSGAITPKEDAIGLLQLAAEVEHALLAQYLYLAASIDGSGGSDSKSARRAITTIAIQEMGHLVAVQNLLLAIGGRDAHHLGRDALRASSDRNPLPLVLEPLNHAALAKYVTVERPDKIADPELEKRVTELEQEAQTSAQVTPHPVVSLYAAIYWIFQPSDRPFDPFHLPADHFVRGGHLTPADFLDRVIIDQFGSTSNEWAGFPDLTLDVVHDAAEACHLLNRIMVQGEGAAGSADVSHFTRFLGVLDAFEANRLKTLPLCRTPRVQDQPSPEDPHATAITHPYTELWGRLFNLRYTHLVFTIGHTLSLAVDDSDRDALSKLALTLMRPGLSALIQQLTRLDIDTNASSKAGPPFGLLDDSFPSDPKACWTRHRTFVADHAKAASTITGRAEFAADASGQLVLQQLANVDQPLQDLLAARS